MIGYVSRMTILEIFGHARITDGADCRVLFTEANRDESIDCGQCLHGGEKKVPPPDDEWERLAYQPFRCRGAEFHKSARYDSENGIYLMFLFFPFPLLLLMIRLASMLLWLYGDRTHKSLWSPTLLHFYVPSIQMPPGDKQPG